MAPQGTARIVEDRLIGEYGEGSEGPLVICLAGIHGNEPAGIDALRVLFEQLVSNKPEFKGRFVGLAGNLPALAVGKRYIDYDLNRNWDSAIIAQLRRRGPEHTEDAQLLELVTCIEELLSRGHPNTLVIDLHTTSAFGGMFTIANRAPKSLFYASHLKVPVIHGLNAVLKGTTLNYFEKRHIPAIGFEAGHHSAPRSIDYMIGALYLTLAGMGCIRPQDLEPYWRYSRQLHQLAQSLPANVKFVYRHSIRDKTDFAMRHGFENFQRVKAGEVLADDSSGPVAAPMDGILLMPLYQQQGDDGFFLVRPVAV